MVNPQSVDAESFVADDRSPSTGRLIDWQVVIARRGARVGRIQNRFFSRLSPLDPLTLPRRLLTTCSFAANIVFALKI